MGLVSVHFGFLLGVIEYSDDNVRYLTETVQDQYFEIQSLEAQIQACEYNAGVKEHIFLTIYNE